MKRLILLPNPRRVELQDTPRMPWNKPLATLVVPGVLPAQGYRLVLTAERIEITAGDEAGQFYARKTLQQLEREFPDGYPTGVIEDWPDFPVRGVMLDISRDKVPRMETLMMLVDELAEWKINRFELYTEHTFAYARHPDVWAMASPMTPTEIRQLDSYCRERFIELVPNQNSFGHMERWLKIPRLRHLAECPDGFDAGWGKQPPATLDPTNPGSIDLLGELYDELLPNFTSRNMNVGCDETFELGLGRSRTECERRGKGRVYLDFLLKVYELTQRHGRRMHFWGDIILEHPELIGELPRDVVPLAWGYEATKPFGPACEAFANAGLEFFVCPGTSSWLSILGRTANCLANLDDAARSGRRCNASGYLVTDWGDRGHWQQLPISYLGYAVGAALSWCYQTNYDQPWAEVLNRHVFHDPTGVLGRIAYDMGNAYQEVGYPSYKGRFFHDLIEKGRAAFPELPAEVCHRALDYLDRAERHLPSARPLRPDAAWLYEEFAHSFRMARFACRVGLNEDPLKLGAELRVLMGEHQRLWLQRNRPGGLYDSLKRFERRLAEFDAVSVAARGQTIKT
ncbi:MAG: family 20 glycosylhydrolase [Verrucomicrobiota bacterium]|nr:family 20 glycosylhydrolase [Verrucomicrobiota bacterium]